MRSMTMLLLCALPFAAMADEQPAPDAAKVPYKLFENAAVGDWCALVGKNPGGESAVLVWTITKVEGDKVTLTMHERSGGSASEGNEAEFAKGEAPVAFTVIMPHEKDVPGAPDAKSTEEKRTVGDTELACHKLVFSMTDNDLTVHVEVWFSKQVKGAGLVSLTLKMGKGDNQDSATAELAGYGSAGKTEWGKSADELHPLTAK